MRTIKSLLVMTAVVGLVAMKAFAGPIPPSLPDPKIHGPVLGESTLVSADLDPGPGTQFTYMEIDWQVIWDPVMEAYGYFYQVENRATNSLGDDVSSFTIRVPIGSVIPGTVFISGHDWDGVSVTLPPGAAPHNVSGEITEANLGNQPTSGWPGVGTVTWTWDSANQLQPGTETVIIGFYSPLPPVYGIGNLFDGGEAVGWGPAFNPESQFIPVPSPEPTTAVLILMGLGFGVFYRRRRS